MLQFRGSGLRRRKKQKLDSGENVEQFNGREGETATLLSTGFVSLTLRVGGFAPRHLSRSAFPVLQSVSKIEKKVKCKIKSKLKN